MKPDIRCRRVYDPPRETDGRRILVDRIWPRGLSRNDAAIDLWLKDIAPSAELRKWFGHDPERWEAFVDRYARELDDNPQAVEQLLGIARSGPVTLVYAARDTEYNNAWALKIYIEDRFA